MKRVSLLVLIALSAAAVAAAAQDPIPKPQGRANPMYPRVALQKGIEGSVLLEFTVDRDGYVVAPRVVDATPRGVFERAALDAVSRWSYQPLGVETKGVQVRLTFRKRGRARWTPTPTPATLVRGDPSRARRASDALGE